MSQPTEFEDLNLPEQPESEFERTDATQRRTNRQVRLGILIVSLAAITVIGAMHQLAQVAKPVGVDALCPFGGLETLWSLLSGGGFIQKVALSSLILLIGTVITAVLFRRVFCGYLCPLGALQELFGKIGHRIWGRKRPTVPAAIDRPARYLKYLVLIVISLWTWQAGELVIRAFDPWVAYMHLTSAEVLAEFSLGLVVLGVSLAGSVVYDRFFCKYLCPMGAFLGVVSKVAPFAVTRDADACTTCGACDKACPSNIAVSTASTVTTAECISCNECVNACPAKGALGVSGHIGASGFEFEPQKVLGITLVIMAALVGTATANDSFQWGKATAPVVDAAGTIDVETIKGYMTFEQISAASGVPAQAFEARFGIKPADMTVPVKDLAPTYGFDVHTDLREFVAEQVKAGAVVPAGGAGAEAGS